MIDALSSIEITDADIEEIERLFGDVKFDDERRQILKHMESTDIQAFPGSGKTTVLVATQTRVFACCRTLMLPETR